MTEIPEHLRKRSADAKAKAEAAKAAPEPAPEAAAPAAPAGGDAPASEGASKIPAHLLERSRAAKAKASGGGGGGAAGGAAAGGGGAGAKAPAAAAAAASAVATAAPPAATGPGGHTQRLLTVVKAGSIQDVKATPVDKVHTWPHLLVVEFVAALAVLGFLLIFSTFVNAPLLQLANINNTPNPSKAPWYFLGLQELLTMFHPMVAGVTIPGMGLFLLILAPYIDRNPSNKPEDRKFSVSIFTVFLMFWMVLVVISSFFRGPGYNFVYPWTAGMFFEL